MAAASTSSAPNPGSGPGTRSAATDLGSAAPNLVLAATILDAARPEGFGLTEPEGLALLESVGISVPRHVVVRPGERVTEQILARFPGDRVVLKAVAPGLTHKSEVGGVMVVERRAQRLMDAIAAMTERLGPVAPTGFLVEELVEHDAALGGELLLALRWTDDFGAVVSIGAGGIHAELLARDLQPTSRVAMIAPGLTPPGAWCRALRAASAVRLATEPQRGRPALMPVGELVDVVKRLALLSPLCGPRGFLECEINPLAVTAAGPVALDVLVTLGRSAGIQRDAHSPVAATSYVERPTHKLARLLEPATIAITGVSSGENPGRAILRNILRDGFDPARITVIKPGVDSIDGCRCVPDLGDLAATVDLLVVALSAAGAAAMVADAIERDSAASIIVIPGGLEEKAGGEGLAGRIRLALDAARSRPGGGPLINGGNCLGIRSRPGRYDTFFIPESKLAPPSGHPAPLAIVAQSGAFALSRMSRLRALDPKYVISVGNQMDLTIGDHLDHLRDDPEIRVFGVYVEGFAPLDGRRFLDAARAITDRGGTVVLYRAGRTLAGASASASHTASIAGDALISATLARQAGVIVADTLEAFDDLVRTLVLLDGRAIVGPRLGAMSNAGFECVAIADNLDGLSLASFGAQTQATLRAILERARLSDIVDIHDPFDLTPMGDDATFAAVAEAILDDEGVDVALIGNVPFTAALQTLPADAGASEDLAAPRAVASRLADLWRRSTKAWVTVVDGGARYDPLAATLEASGIPTFRTADAALRTLAAIVEHATT